MPQGKPKARKNLRLLDPGRASPFQNSAADSRRPLPYPRRCPFNPISSRNNRLFRSVFLVSTRPLLIDALCDSVYIRTVPAKKIQVGQLWKKEDSGESFLVTKVYNEALTTYAVLRKAGAETEPPLRIKVSRAGAAADLPGFVFTQQSDF
jgi:hypothetical protein